MPNCLNQDSYHQNQVRVAEASKILSTMCQRDVSKKYGFTAYSELGVEPDDEGVLDIGVSFNEWQKRGHSSHNGMVSVIDLITGLPLQSSVTFLHEVYFGRKQ